MSEEEVDDLDDKDDGHVRPTGMKGFSIIWVGQVVSVLGTAMTYFALFIWIWEETGQATPFALFSLSYSLPLIVASPLAGVFVDRWDRKLTMALSDLAAGASSVIILLLFFTGHLQVWHLYFTVAFAGFFGAFQSPAFSAATTMMVSEEHYARASAMRSMASNGSRIFAPIIAAGLITIIGIQGILIIDIITFSFAVGVLLLVYIPEPPVSEEGDQSLGSIWKESIFGFKYIFNKKSLFGLLLVSLAINFAFSMSSVLRVPMILARTGNNEVILGGVQSASALGGLIGGILLTIWGGPTKKIRAVFIGLFFIGLANMLMGIQEGLIVWGLAGFGITFSAVYANSSSQSFWQSKIPPDIQGKVFSARSMLARIAMPLSMVIAGPLADAIFEPGMTQGGSMAKVFGGMIGTENGSGISLMFLLTGIAVVAVTLIGYSFKKIRNAEKILPDHEATGSPEE